MSIGLLTESRAYKPHRYPWAYDAWQAQQRSHWLPEEVNLGEDVKDWRSKLTSQEREFLTQIFRFFTQADIDIADGYKKYLSLFKPVEVNMMLLSFANMETIHIAAYALLIETLGMPESEFSKFLEYSEMVEKHEHLASHTMKTDRDVLKGLAVYSAFSEGVQLFGSFAMLLNFTRHGLMKGMGQIIAFSIRDETLHADSVIKLFRVLCDETGLLDATLKKEIQDEARQITRIEDRFIELAFAGETQRDLTEDQVKQYIRFLIDWRLRQLGIEPLTDIKEHPLPWLPALISAPEHSNFFETRATEYSKGATRGQWHESWQRFDEHREATR